MSEDPSASRQLGPELPWASLRRFRARLTPGEVIMIGARPKVGKSCAARQIAEFAAGQGYGVVVYSLEMDGRQVNRRSMAAEARRNKAGRGDVREVVGMTAQEIQEGRLDQREWARVATATEKIRQLPIWVATGSSYTIQELEISVRKFARRQRAIGRDFGAFVVDYFQLLNVATGKGENKAQSMAEASRRIKMLAREVKACALVVVQLNRQAADDKPRSHHARDTGALEADAAMMILLHRLEGADEAEFLIPLNRGGKGGGEFRMRFDGPSEAFIDPEDIEEL
jgi:replicative DNA helicase